MNRDVAPIAQRIALALATVANLDNRIAQLDAMANDATSRGWTKTARLWIPPRDDVPD